MSFNKLRFFNNFILISGDGLFSPQIRFYHISIVHVRSFFIFINIYYFDIFFSRNFFIKHIINILSFQNDLIRILNNISMIISYYFQIVIACWNSNIIFIHSQYFKESLTLKYRISNICFLIFHIFNPSFTTIRINFYSTISILPSSINNLNIIRFNNDIIISINLSK